jgi:hypothetical protein
MRARKDFAEKFSAKRGIFQNRDVARMTRRKTKTEIFPSQSSRPSRDIFEALKFPAHCAIVAA